MTLEKWRTELDTALNTKPDPNNISISQVQTLLMNIPPSIDKRIACTPAQLKKSAELNGTYNFFNKYPIHKTNLYTHSYTMVFLAFKNTGTTAPDPALWNAKIYGSDDAENRNLFREKLSCWCYENFSAHVKIGSAYRDSDTPADLLEEKFAAIVKLDNAIKNAPSDQSLATILDDWKNKNSSDYHTLSEHRDWSGWALNKAETVWATFFKNAKVPLKPSSQQIFDDACTYSTSIKLTN